MIEVMIVGAQKAGTTALHNALKAHPSIHTHPQMEMTFFYLDDEYAKGTEHLRNHYHLEKSENKYVVAKHALLSRSTTGIARLYEHNPKCRILFCMRDPVDRAFSSYLMEKRNGSISMDFDQVMELAFKEKKKHWFYNVFVELGCYEKHIERVKEKFPEDQIKTIELEEIKSKDAKLHEVFEWLGIDSTEGEFRFSKVNSKEERSIVPLSRSLNKSKTLKKVLLAVFGRQLLIKLAKSVSYLFIKKAKIESIDDYPFWRDELRKFYASGCLEK